MANKPTVVLKSLQDLGLHVEPPPPPVPSKAPQLLKAMEPAPVAPKVEPYTPARPPVGEKARVLRQKPCEVCGTLVTRNKFIGRVLCAVCREEIYRERREEQARIQKEQKARELLGLLAEAEPEPVGPAYRPHPDADTLIEANHRRLEEANRKQRQSRERLTNIMGSQGAGTIWEIVQDLMDSSFAAGACKARIRILEGSDPEIHG